MKRHFCCTERGYLATRLVVLLLVLLTCSPGRGQNPPPAAGEPGFEIGFAAPAFAHARPGEKARFEADVLLYTLGIPAGAPGALGWSVFVTTHGCHVTEVSWSGTVAALISDDPPGIIDFGFRKKEILSCDCPRGFHGAISAIVLSFLEPLSLDPGNSPHPILALAIEEPVDGTVGVCSDCTLSIIDDDDCNICHLGQAVYNAVTVEGETHVMQPRPHTVQLCSRLSAPFHRGDVTDDGDLDIVDGTKIFGYLFKGDEPPGCLEAGDANDDGKFDIADGVFLLNHLFLGGAPPPAPGPPTEPCGDDPGKPAGDLGCESYESC